MLSVGCFFYFRNKDKEDYYVGGRSMGSGHIGLSVVATDVGGGFSIGLGGLGFIMGISGSWMLFTGLIGAWLSSVLLIPRVFKVSREHGFLTFPQMFKHFYNGKVALAAGIISAIGYVGFTSSQLLAGAKLASATFVQLDLKTALVSMGVIAVAYTVVGGLKAVIYTDTVQWIILMIGLLFIGIPLGYNAVGGMSSIKATLSQDFLSLSNIDAVTFLNWLITIVPIWFVGMTLYQRIYACRDEKTARNAWMIAGLFEYPIMAFMGVILGLFARVAFDQNMFADIGYAASGMIDPELGLPLLLRSILPVGLMGLMLSAYFSAIMSTADSCLMAASGNITTDILHAGKEKEEDSPTMLRTSQIITLVIGVLAIILASFMENVLDLMLQSYAFMVSGLFVPVLAIIFQKSPNAKAALWSIVSGGILVLILSFLNMELPFGLDPIIAGISISALSFILVDKLSQNK